MPYRTVTDQITQPLPGVAVTGSLATANYIGLTLPDIVQLFGAIYAILLVVHKVYQMYKEWKEDRKDESKK